MDERNSPADGQQICCREEKEAIAHQLTEATNMLMSKDAEYVQMETYWQSKYNLQEKFAQDMAIKNMCWEMHWPKHQNVLKQVEFQVHQRDTEILHLRKEKEMLSHQLMEASNMLLTRDSTFVQMEKFWQVKYNALEEELSKKHQFWEKEVKLMQTTVTFLEEDKKELTKKCTNDLDKKQQFWETEVKRMETEVKRMETEVKRMETEVNKMEDDKKDLEEKSTKDLAKKQYSWEMKVKLMEMKVKRMEEDKKELEGNSTKDLAERQHGWEQKVKLMEKKVKEMEDNLATKEQSWETKEKEVEVEKKELEELCLTMNKKKRGFLFRKKKTEERHTELQKLKDKMHEKEMKKKEKVEKANEEKTGFWSWMHTKNRCDSHSNVEEEAAGSSSQAGQQ